MENGYNEHANSKNMDVRKNPQKLTIPETTQYTRARRVYNAYMWMSVLPEIRQNTMEIGYSEHANNENTTVTSFFFL